MQNILRKKLELSRRVVETFQLAQLLTLLPEMISNDKTKSGAMTNLISPDCLPLERLEGGRPSQIVFPFSLFLVFNLLQFFFAVF